MDALELESWVRRAREGEASPEQLAEVFSEATLIFPLTEHDAETGQSAPLVVEDPEGQAYVVVFTEPRRMAAFGEAMDFLETTGAELATTWPAGLFMIINPGTPELELAIDDVAVRRWGGVETEVLEAGTEMMIGPPDEVPGELVEIIHELVRESPGIAEVYLFTWVTDEGPRLTGGVVLEPDGVASRDVPTFIQAVLDAYPEATGMPWLPLNDDLREAIRSESEPI